MSGFDTATDEFLADVVPRGRLRARRRSPGRAVQTSVDPRETTRYRHGVSDWVTTVSPAIRRAEPGDLDVVVELHRQFCAADDHPFSPERARAAVPPLLDDDRCGVVWLAVDPDGRPLGYAAVTWGWSIESGGPEAVLDEIYAVEQGRGIGSTLLTHLIGDARRRGLARIFLETERGNSRGRELYARHGFVADDSIWMSLDFVDLS